MYRKNYRKLCREKNHDLVGLKVKISDCLFGQYKKYDIRGCIGVIVRNKTGGKYGIKIDGKKNSASNYGIFWLEPDYFNVVKEESEEHNMAKLTGYNKVAVIKQGYGVYHFAIYNDGFDYQPGDKVLVSSDKQIQTIDEVITPEESTQKFNKNITAEVICKIDTSFYDIRVEDRKRAADVKQKMDAMIKKMDETNKYEMYAERNPELKELLEAYKELVG